jgi:hypothetical protein
MAGIFWVLRVGNFAGVSFGGLLARIANNLLKRVRTGGIPQLGGGGGSLAEARQQCCRRASQRTATAAEVVAVATLPKALPLPTKSRFRGISDRQVSFHGSKKQMSS